MDTSVAHPRIEAIAAHAAENPHTARASAEQLLAALDSPHSHYAHAPVHEREQLREQVQALLRTLPPPRKRRRARAHAHAREEQQPRRPAPTVSAEQLELFGGAQRWPRRPWCTDDLSAGLRVRGLAQALTKPYVQANPPHLRVWSIYDVDRAGAALAWESAGLPPPSWAAVNRENGHAHIVYGLSAPVLYDHPSARDAPLRYLCAVEACMREMLQADPGYSGLITKNPLHPLWRTLRGPKLGYELGELAEYLPNLDKHRPRPGVQPERVGLGRNVALFDTLRHWAYREIRKYWGGGLDAWNAWLSACNSRGLVLNADMFAGRLLHERECWHIAKSVAKWTWREFTPAAFSAIQAARGRRSGEARRAGSITEAQPWVAMGISRATWYRRKSGLIVPEGRDLA